MDHAVETKGSRCARTENLFHTLRTKLGIKDSERHLVLKYHGCLHKHIQEEMDFLHITSLGTAYCYATEIYTGEDTLSLHDALPICRSVVHWMYLSSYLPMG